jgi:diguanylate cyclase (GGDEF)-like protein
VIVSRLPLAAPAAVAGIAVTGIAIWAALGLNRPSLLAAAILGPLVSVVLCWRSLAALAESARLATTDRLTGLGNDRGFGEQLERDLERARAAGDPLTLCILDVDDFKEVNDRYGHPVGDEVLLRVAACLTHGSRAFRIGGDEFALVLPGLGEASGRAIAEEVIERIADSSYVHHGGVTASAGIASFPTQGTDSSDLIRRADAALYRAKADGKNCVRSRRSDGEGPELTGQDLRAGLRRTALALARAVSERAAATGPRIPVPDLAARVARQMGLDPEEAELIRVAGGLNDIGKLALPDDILAKPGPLDPSERRTVEQHPQIGYRILSSLGVDPVATWVLHHHERWDGHGYPARLSGDQIPLGSRILFVADAYEAMTADQAWRRAMTPSAAIAELERCAGTQFDPDVVAAFAAEVRGPVRLVV